GQVEGGRAVARAEDRADRGEQRGIGGARDRLAPAQQEARRRARAGKRQHDARRHEALRRRRIVVVAYEHVHALGERAGVGGGLQRGESHQYTLSSGRRKAFGTLKPGSGGGCTLKPGTTGAGIARPAIRLGLSRCAGSNLAKGERSWLGLLKSQKFAP